MRGKAFDDFLGAMHKISPEDMRHAISFIVKKYGIEITEELLSTESVEQGYNCYEFLFEEMGLGITMSKGDAIDFDVYYQDDQVFSANLEKVRLWNKSGWMLELAQLYDMACKDILKLATDDANES